MTKKSWPNGELIEATIIKDGFMLANVILSTLISALKNKKKYHLIPLTNNAGLMKELDDNSFYQLLNNKSVAKI